MRYPTILLIALLAGCARTYVIPFTMGESHVPIVMGIININSDHLEVHPPPKRLCIDTGAAHTAFFAPPDVIPHLPRLLRHAELEDRQTADGTIIQVCHFEKARVMMGALTIDMPVDASPHAMIGDAGMDGVIGVDFLSRFDVRLDFKTNTITLIERN